MIRSDIDVAQGQCQKACLTSTNLININGTFDYNDENASLKKNVHSGGILHFILFY